MSSSRLPVFKKVMEQVYGACNESVASWSPKPYPESPRYLWTDAFGVCNFITLHRETGEEVFLEQAKKLVSTVHDTLGKTHDLQKRLGNATDQHPLLGGLRIGKKDEEGHYRGDHFRGDGQYYHYLTKWMFALNRLSIAAADKKYNDLAIELATSVHSKFVYNRGSERPRIYWKMRIDLSDAWVRSEGHDDPYDGFVAYRMIQDTSGDKSVLENEIDDLRKIVMKEYKSFDSHDSLGLGCMLISTQAYPEEPWSQHIAHVCLKRLDALRRMGEFPGSLAFREFGAYIGVLAHSAQSAEKWRQFVDEMIEHWQPKIFKRDSDITPVMFCSVLIPGCIKQGYI